jgi:tRNA-Thr(GGU) m(6)t(6)A37 methyltransferase TsaA
VILQPIGHLSTPWKAIEACPRNGRVIRPAPLCHATVLPEFLDGLLSLEGFSHLIVLYWLDAGPPQTLVFQPPFDESPRGVFATRAPWRPNRIGLSVVSFGGYEDDGRLRVRYLDCLDGTTLLDIKPYLPSTDSEPAAVTGWLARHVGEPAGSEP